MVRDLAALADREFDLVVVGGGIAGACAAWDAALRGLTVALLERGDFCGATSAHSLKIVHGGIRYLQHADVVRLRESSRERSGFLRIAPHLVHPLPFVVPAYGHGMQGKEALFAAFRALGLLTWDRNRGITDPARRLPGGRLIGRDETLRLFPELPRKGLTGAGIFHDGQMYSPPRIVLSIVRSAAAAGAVVANYCEARGLLTRNGRLRGIAAVDRLSGRPFDVRGKLVLNAAGPFAEEFLEQAGLRQRRDVPLSRDLAIVLPRPWPAGKALAVQTKYKDPDAMFSRGARHLFIVPWREYTLIGVNSKVYTGEPSRLQVTREEVQGFLDEINEAYPVLGLRAEDLSAIHAGLLPFGENAPTATHLSFGKRSILVDHSTRDGLDGLLTIMSVRYTTGRSVAQRAVDLVFRKLGQAPPPCRTDRVPAWGGEYERFEGLLREARGELPETVSDASVTQLCRNHGARYAEPARLIRDDPTLARSVGPTAVLQAQVLHAVRDEMAVMLEDVVLRRTDLGPGGAPGDEALDCCGRLMASELGWDEPRLREEVSRVKSSFFHPDCRIFWR